MRGACGHLRRHRLQTISRRRSTFAGLERKDGQQASPPFPTELLRFFVKHSKGERLTWWSAVLKMYGQLD